jgi:phage terminase Nu1 subunit (DNA packaging protein)
LEGILLRKEGGGERFFPVPKLSKKVIIIAINYTNKRISTTLREQGVPIIEDKKIEETKNWHLKQMMEYGMRYGGASKLYLAHQKVKGKPALIEDTGRPIFQEHFTKVDARQVLDEILKQKGRRIFLQTRLVFTHVGIQRHRKPMRKFKTILWSSPENLELRYPTHLECTDKLPEGYWELVSSVFFLGGIFENYVPPSISIELTGRQPLGKPNCSLFFQFENG